MGHVFGVAIKHWLECLCARWNVRIGVLALFLLLFSALFFEFQFPANLHPRSQKARAPMFASSMRKLNSDWPQLYMHLGDEPTDGISVSKRKVNYFKLSTLTFLDSNAQKSSKADTRKKESKTFVDIIL